MEFPGTDGDADAVFDLFDGRFDAFKDAMHDFVVEVGDHFDQFHTVFFDLGQIFRRDFGEGIVFGFVAGEDAGLLVDQIDQPVEIVFDADRKLQRRGFGSQTGLQ
jgi:hypothetical protein